MGYLFSSQLSLAMSSLTRRSLLNKKKGVLITKSHAKKT
jgi:hypothetical protein